MCIITQNDTSALEIDTLENSGNLRQRLKWEICHKSYSGRFDLEEPSGEYINLESSFAPKRPFYATVFIKAFLLAWSLQVLYTDVMHYPPHNLFIYMGYLTHWGHVMSILYLMSALYCNMNRSLLIQPSIGKTPPFPVRFTWALYCVVAPMEICITLLYWSADYDGGSANYITVMEHGIICLFVLFDGLVVSLIPIRIKMFPYFLSICISYLIWSILDAVLDIGNGEWGPEYEDDALYEVLNWKSDSKTAVILSAVVICVIAPLIYLFCWALSLWDGSISCNGLKFDGSRRNTYHQEVVTADDTDKDFDYKEIAIT